MYITHIQPVNSSQKIYQPIEMYLAHLVRKYPFRFMDVKKRDTYKILDNSYHELGYSLDLDEILRIAHQIKASEIVLPDRKDVDDYIAHIDEDIKRCNGFNTMAVVHANTWQELGEQIGFFCSIPQLTTIGLPKPIADFQEGRGRIIAAQIIELKSHGKKEVHFLGSGLGLPEVTGGFIKAVRSMDTGYFLTPEALDRSILEKRDNSIIIDLETKHPATPNQMFLRIKEVSMLMEELSKC